MHELYSSLETLFKSGLYSNFCKVYPFVDVSSLSKCEALNLNIYQGISLQNLNQFRRAESVYQDTLQQIKQYNKQKNKSDTEHLFLNEIEVKYRLHECYVALGQSTQAVNLLQNIPPKQRDKKIYNALGNLYLQSGLDSPASAAFREVIKECPLALDAVVSLLKLGVTAREIQEVVTAGGKLPSSDCGWYQSYVNAQAALYSKDFKTCIKECKYLDEKTELQGCVDLLVTQGLAHTWAGEEEQAILVLQRASICDTLLLTGMDTLAALLHKSNKARDLENLTTRLMGVSDEQAESWVALAHYCHLNKNYKRAVYFAHKACTIQPRNVEALLLKGNLFLDLKKYRDAINHFREALQIAPYRLEAHQGVVECNIGLQRHREAANAGTIACKQFNNSPRALTLYATALLKEPLAVARAKTLLERAAGAGHLPAVYLLVDLLEREGAQDKAVTLIKKSLQYEGSGKLHQLLAELLAKQGLEEEAMEHYSLALSLNPKDEAAQAGLQRIEAANEGGLEASYDLEMTEVGSNNDSLGGRVSPSRGQDLEDSETEAVWSDGDLNIMGGS